MRPFFIGAGTPLPDYKLRIIIEGVDKASGAINSVKTSLGDIGKIALGSGLGDMLVGGLSGAAGMLAGIASGALNSYAAYERLGQSVNSLAAKEALLTGQATSMQEALAQTSGKSKELLDWVQKLAIASPFKQEDVAGAFRLSMALGFSTSEAQRLTAAMLNFSTATGAGGETIERVARALGQIRTKGRLSLEEINQLTESGVDAMRILSDATGLTGKALTDSISKGAISADTAIQAIIADTERLYAGAGEASAESMSGLLSTLEEIGDLSSRNLLAGVFQSAQPYIAGVVGLLTAPEFQAGLTLWGEKLGGFTGDALETAAGNIERVMGAVQPLLDAQAPAWLVTLQGLMAVGDYTLGIDIKPEITTIKTPDGGLTVDVTATATTITTTDGGEYIIDVAGRVVSLDADTTDDLPPVRLVADWKQGTIGSLIATVQAETDAEQRTILLNAGWKPETAPGLQSALNFSTDWAIPVMATINPASRVVMMAQLAADLGVQAWEGVQVGARWAVGEPEALQASLQGYLTGFVLAAEWGGGVLTGLWGAVQGWFTANPINIFANAPTVEYGTEHSGHSNHPRKPSGGTYPNDVTGPYPQTYIDPVTGEVKHFAKGGRARGWAVVGEQGPELAYFGGGGAHIFSNPDSKTLLAAGVPGFATGTTPLPDWTEAFKQLLRPFGLWVPQQAAGAQMGPRTRDEAYGGWQTFQRKGTEAMQGAAKQAGDAFEQAANDTNDAFKSALGSVPGLMGTSQVTGDQMRLAELGVPQNFADDYLRQLSDEVLNGVDWEGVDIQDAAARAGIDPNLPADVILELFKNAWDNSSLFANPANLDLINQDAVQAAIEQQQKELTGKANIMQLFGITDENLQGQAEALGAGLASVFGEAAGTDAMKAAGVQAFAAVGAGFGDSDTAIAAVGGMAVAVTSATGTPDNQTALADAGKAGAHAYYGGWRSYMGEAAVVPPGGTVPTAPGPLPPGNALGTPRWRGGWTVVGEHGPELVDLPGGSRIHNAGATHRRLRATARQTVVNQTFIVNDKLMAEQAAQRAVQLIRRGG